MITLTELETILIAALPALTSIIAIVTAIVKFCKSLNELKDNEKLKIERDQLVEQNKILLNEMRKTRKIYQLYIEKAVKIKYEDLTEVQNDKELQD